VIQVFSSPFQVIAGNTYELNGGGIFTMNGGAMTIVNGVLTNSHLSGGVTCIKVRGSRSQNKSSAQIYRLVLFGSFRLPTALLICLLC
jgi:hypothetical protein